MAKLMKVRGSTPAHLLMGRAGIQPVRNYALPESVWYATLAGTLDSTNGGGTFTRTGDQASYINDAGIMIHVAANVPRYQGHGILIEPTAKNSVTYNNNIGGTTWTTGFFSTAYVQSITAPDGTLTATEICAGSGFGSNFDKYDLPTADFPAASTRTASVYAKLLGTNPNHWLRIGIRHANGSSFSYQWFNVSTGAIGSTTGSSVAPTIAGISGPDASGYYRCDMTFVNSGSGTDVRYFLQNSYGDGSSAGTATVQGNGIAVWGAQVENSGYVTSYIRNTGATLNTRGQDVPTLAGMPLGYNRTLGALSMRVTPTVAQGHEATGVIWGGNVIVTYGLIGNDGVFDTPNFQSSNGSTSVTTHVIPIEDATYNVVITFDAAGAAAFPGTKRFSFINGTKRPRQNSSGSDDSFTTWPVATANVLGNNTLSLGAFPCVISNLAWWPELADGQAIRISLGVTP